jgi:hypothetical protein
MPTLSRRMGRTIALLALAAALVAAPSGADPKYHGQLRVDHSARGNIDLTTGKATFTIKNWALLLAPDSNGIDPLHELITVFVDNDGPFPIEIGQVHASRNGRRFTYKGQTDRGVQAFTLVKTRSGAYRLNLKLAGVDLSSLVVAEPPNLCLNFAIIIGDDDGFQDVTFELPKPYPSTRLSIPGFCSGSTTWPWVS